ncbi:hypothetical protein [Gilliamella mensalis]|uniref:hypothetical protein n=1 Tax=Gilliamella mensalis TaxID=1908520 RepID=UPI000A14CAFC|nr:hypothetical protein [Gilliamella mensalis]
MNKIITPKNVNKMICAVIPFLFCTISHAYLTVRTAKEIQSNLPSLSTEIEQNIEYFEFFRLTIDGKNYYGNQVAKMPLSFPYPFKHKMTITPNLEQYIDGDELGYLAIQSPAKITWYDANSGTFCALAKEGKYYPYNIKISGHLILAFKYGILFINHYLNNSVIKQPSIMYTNEVSHAPMGKR